MSFSNTPIAKRVAAGPPTRWGDRKGTRRVLTRIVTWWSLFTVLTGAAFSYVQLLITRFLFGVGEAGAWPNVAVTFAKWFPKKDRGTAQGFFFMGAHAAAGLTPLLVTTLLLYFHWRMFFVMFGGFLSPTVVGTILTRFPGNWDAPLYITGTLYLFGAVCWLGVDPNRKLAE